MASVLKPVGQLAGGRGFAGTLQAGHEHHSRRLRSKLQAGRLLAEYGDKFVADNFDDLVAGGERGHYFLADGFRLDLIDQLLDDFEVYVGLEQSETDLAQGLLNIFLVEDGLPAQGFKGTLELLGKILEHRRNWLF